MTTGSKLNTWNYSELKKERKYASDFRAVILGVKLQKVLETLLLIGELDVKVFVRL